MRVYDTVDKWKINQLKAMKVDNKGKNIISKTSYQIAIDINLSS